MPSTFTDNTGIEKIADGEQSGLWGQTTNLNLDIVDRALNGVGAIALSGTTHTLTTTAGALSDGQFAVLVFGGTPSGTNTVTIAPNTAQKTYFVINSSGEDVILTQGSGSTVTIPDGEKDIIVADGAGAGAAVVSLASDLSGLFPFDQNLKDFVDTFTLPTTDGTSGQALVTDGSGNVSFGDAGIGFGKAVAAALIFG